MLKSEIEEKLNELKNCTWITIGCDNQYQTVLYNDIQNCPEKEYLLYKIDNKPFYYKDITMLKPSPLDEVRS